MKPVVDILDVNTIEKNNDYLADYNHKLDALLTPVQFKKQLKELEKMMYSHAKELKFEQAANCRNKIIALKNNYIMMEFLHEKK